MIHIGSFLVPVVARSGRQTSISISAIGPTNEFQIPQDGWRCSWTDLWAQTDPACQAVISLTHVGEVFGLLRYGLYPYPGNAQFLEIENIEANPSSVSRVSGYNIPQERLLKPVGSWLVWYAVSVALSVIEASDPVVVLTSVGDAVGYYRDTIGMSYQGTATIAPGEDGHVFKFSRKQAESFWSSQIKQWGKPSQIAMP